LISQGRENDRKERAGGGKIKAGNRTFLASGISSVVELRLSNFAWIK